MVGLSRNRNKVQTASKPVQDSSGMNRDRTGDSPTKPKSPKVPTATLALFESTEANDVAMSDTEPYLNNHRRGSSAENFPARDGDVPERRSSLAHRSLVIRERRASHEPGWFRQSVGYVKRKDQAPAPRPQGPRSRTQSQVDDRDAIIEQQKEVITARRRELDGLRSELAARDATITLLGGQAQKNDSLQRSSSKRESDISQYQTQMRTLQQRLSEADSKLATINTEHAAQMDLQRRYRERLSRDVATYKHHYEQATQDLEFANSHLQMKENDIAQLNQELERAMVTNEQTSREVNKLRSSMRTIQENAFSSLESAQWAPRSASEVGRCLTDILAEIKQWSKRYALDKALEYDVLINTIPDEMKLLGPPETLRTALTRQKAGTWLGLSAIIAVVAFQRIFGDPFFAFHQERGQTPDMTSMSKQDADSVLNLLHLIERSDGSGANGWRCQLLRLLDPARSNKSEEARNLRELTAGNRNMASDDLAALCVQKVATMLREEGTPQTDLQIIFRKCTDFAWTLWSQKSFIKILDLDALGANLKQEHKLLFDSESNLMEPHSQHSRELSDNSQALDRREVLLLVSPAIMTVSIADGADSPTGKIWKKAVVWMG